MLLAASLAFGAIQPATVARLSRSAELLLEQMPSCTQQLVGSRFERVIYLGSNELLGLAHEAALKLLELTDGRIATLAESTLGFRHGPKSMTNLQAQSGEHYDAVREFFIRYQDRILYATDLTQSAETTPAEMAQEAARVWRADWKYLATGETQYVEEVRRDVRGLSLPRAVIDKIYYANAQAALSLKRQ